MLRTLRHPIEAYRTAVFPATISSLCLGSVVTAGTLHALDNTPTPSTNAEIALYGLNLGAALMNGVLAKKKIDLRNRLEHSLDRSGFNERVFALTTETYCDRQAARVACESYGVLAEYEDVCEKNAATASFKWVPHI